MYLILIPLWYVPVVRRFGAASTISRNSRFGGFNSRLGLKKFPIRVTTGIRSQSLELLRFSWGQMAAEGGESQKFPYPGEKPGTYRNTSGGLPRSTCPMVS